MCVLCKYPSNETAAEFIIPEFYWLCEWGSIKCYVSPRTFHVLNHKFIARCKWDMQNCLVIIMYVQFLSFGVLIWIFKETVPQLLAIRYFLSVINHNGFVLTNLKIYYILRIHKRSPKQHFMLRHFFIPVLYKDNLTIK